MGQHDVKSSQLPPSSELIIALVAPVGTNQEPLIQAIKSRLKHYNYKIEEIIKVSKLISELVKVSYKNEDDEYERIDKLMSAGNNLRESKSSILALAASAKICKLRKKEQETTKESQLKPFSRRAFIIDSLKHPDEVQELRKIYGSGFYLIGTFSNTKQRKDYLHANLIISNNNIDKLMKRDEDEGLEYGQQTRNTFQLADIFIHLDYNRKKLDNDINRIFDLIFGNPFGTPTFDEFAMFMAQSSALRSGDLSRQIGAVIAKDNEIIASGVNDCPRYQGGLYWPKYDESEEKYIDEKNGRDFTRGYDSNKRQQELIIENIIQKINEKIPNIDDNLLKEALKQSKIKDLTEYGRVVHAEMEALLFCARNNISSRGATLYTTTFPCHNCAKHIVASGIIRVVYIEPYPKSKAIEFHNEAISLEFKKSDNKKINFEPFIGIGPRKFFELFAMKSHTGRNIKRKDKAGNIIDWKPEESQTRISLLPFSYFDLEQKASNDFEHFCKEKLINEK